jgi:hypothetical protein
MCAQVVVSMRGAAQAGLPPVLQSLYGWLGALQVRGCGIAMRARADRS